jgi:hypothetical protein
MQLPKLKLVTIALALLASLPGITEAAQASAREAQPFQLQPSSLSPSIVQSDLSLGPSPAVRQLRAFGDSDVKFNVDTLMNLLRDHRHEGWVLSAYADPKTRLPLIGAGFSLDLSARDHFQQDALNPYQFLEPSSAELWQAAGLDPIDLQRILLRFTTAPVAPVKHRAHHKRKPPAADITDQEAMKLLRVAIIQAIYNAKAYSRDFDSLTASQQMALTQLVYQMGVNLEGFNQLLGLINDDSASILTLGPGVFDANHWDAVQSALVQSQWARTYRSRAVSVIAMLDPNYLENPRLAELSVSTALPPDTAPVSVSRPAAGLRVVSYRKHSTRQRRKQALRNRKTV